MKLTNLLCKFSSLISKEHNLIRLRVQYVIGQHNLKCGFFTGPRLQCNHAEEFEFEDESIDFGAIAGNDPDKIHTLTVLNAETNFLRQTGIPVPMMFTTEQWQELLKLDSKRDRIQYYKFLYIIEKSKENRKLKTARRQQALMDVRRERPSRSSFVFTTHSPLRYGLTFNSIFHRIREQKINLVDDYHLMMARMYGPHLLIDCSYENRMSKFELHHCAHQLTFGLASNRKSLNPFHIIHCNFDVNGVIMKKFRTLFRETLDNYCSFNFTDKSYLDLYPTDKLIYLSPHSDYEMEKYEPDCTYIIGAFVDQTVHDPLSMDKAKQHGLRTARFPIQKYTNFCKGSEFLPLNQCIDIMNDLKNNCTWEEALKHIAARKLSFTSVNRQKIFDLAMENYFVKNMYGLDKHIFTRDNTDAEDEEELEEAE